MATDNEGIMQNDSGNPALLGQINGAIIVVRSLVQAQNRLNPVVLTRAESLARYCQILSVQMHVPSADAHRLVLAAWVAAFGDEEGPAGEFIRRYDLGRLLHRETDAWGGGPLDEQVFRVARLYIALHARNPKLNEDMALARKWMEKHWGESDEYHLVRKLLQIVKSETSVVSAGTMKGRILILDSEEVVTPILAPPLQAEGFEVAVSDDEDVARQLVKHVRPDVILAERKRHMIDGMAFCKEVKGNPSSASILFFVMSDKAGKTVEREGVLAGADGVLTRPIDLGMLLLKIRKGLESRPVQAERSDGFAGKLSEIAFTDMIQIVCAGGRSVVIELTRGDERGAVYVNKGEVIHAVLGESSGSAAFYALMQWRDGNFHSRQEQALPERTITESVMGLLMEGARQNDEAGNGSEDGGQ